jgi:NADPH2:quinone reductase
MRAVVCNELAPPEKLVLEDRDPPVPAEGQVVIDVRASGVNFVDALFVQGLYQIKPQPPFIPGMEVAGVVSSIGPGVTGVREGDRVISMTGMGGFAEQVACAAGRLIPLPDGMDFDRGAAFVQSYCTALFALSRRGELQEGETLLVLGAAGGVGLAAVDVGQALGARVIAAASSREKLDLCREMGAEEGILYGEESLKERAKELSGGGVNVVYDPVGGEHADPALRTLLPGGRYLVIGFAAGEIPRVPFNLILLKSCQVVGVDWGGWTGRNPEANAELMAEIGTMFAEGKIRPAAPKRYALEDAPRALSDLLARRLVGKAVLVPS